MTVSCIARHHAKDQVNRLLSALDANAQIRFLVADRFRLEL